MINKFRYKKPQNVQVPDDVSKNKNFDSSAPILDENTKKRLKVSLL